MSNIDVSQLEKSVLDFVVTNLKAAKDDIAEYISTKKDDFEAYAKGLADGSLKKELVESELSGMKNVIEAILLKHTLKIKEKTKVEAKKLALGLAEKLIKIIIAAIL